MEPKYALSQGDVKKKKHKITINPQKKSPVDGAIPGKERYWGSWNPVSDVQDGPPRRRPQQEGVLGLKLIS
jgi:hypothetical protein